jgi:hypothetical protein
MIIKFQISNRLNTLAKSKSPTALNAVADCVLDLKADPFLCFQEGLKLGRKAGSHPIFQVPESEYVNLLFIGPEDKIFARISHLPNDNPMVGAVPREKKAVLQISSIGQLDKALMTALDKLHQHRPEVFVEFVQLPEDWEQVNDLPTAHYYKESSPGGHHHPIKSGFGEDDILVLIQDLISAN